MALFKRAIAITPSDSTVLSQPIKGFMVGVTGAVKVNFTEIGTAIVIQAVAGYFYPFSINKVFSTGTSATGIIAVY
jgi:hypothetical protein